MSRPCRRPRPAAGTAVACHRPPTTKAVRDDVAKDLQRAATRLQLAPGAPNVKLLVEGSDPPLADWIAQGGFDAVLLPARRSRLRFGSHPIEPLLRGVTATKVQIIKAGRSQTRWGSPGRTCRPQQKVARQSATRQTD